MSGKLYTFIKLCEKNSIVIPSVQRDYAQGRKNNEVGKIRGDFLNALYEAVTGDGIILDFVYGDIKEGVVTPFDGQQRLTTLFLLHYYAAARKFPDRENPYPDECNFLKNFSYDTRASARNFCRELVKFRPSLKADSPALSDQIRDQSWFPLSWLKDPTVSSMLVMLDAIDEKFKNIDDLWEKLNEGKIQFYFLPLKDMGLTDEHYIKMNSRGKPLTTFENFKAELEKRVAAADEGKAKELINKIDNAWTDMLWKYCSKKTGYVIDDWFLNYFRFVCRILWYQGNVKDKYSNDVFALLETYFSKDKAKESLGVLNKFFDCWCGIRDIKDFFETFMSKEHKLGKIINSEEIDLFRDCIFNYNSFSLGRIVLLYAVILYLINGKIEWGNFIRRIRIINNLINNSGDELADRARNSRMPAVIRQVEEIILNGFENYGDKNVFPQSGFNNHQLNEEITKQKYLEDHENVAEVMFTLEDHELLQGQISIIGIENAEKYAERFKALFDCNKVRISRALMTIGDYGQSEANGWRYQYADSNNNTETWKYLFHMRENNKEFNKTAEILRTLLENNIKFDNDVLDGIADAYIQPSNDKLYPWSYYYVKYTGSFGSPTGKYVKDNYEANIHKYMVWVMPTEKRTSKNTYMPYLKVIKKHFSDKDKFPDTNLIWSDYNNGHQTLRCNDIIIECKNDGYIVNDEKVNVPQNEKGIDTVDRIEMICGMIEEYIKTGEFPYPDNKKGS